MSLMVFDGVTSLLHLKDVTNTCKRMRRSLSIGRSSSVAESWKKLKTSMPFVVYCVLESK